LTTAVLQQELQALEGPWRELHRRGALPYVFLTPTWLRIWWEEFGEGRPLLLLAAHRSQEIIGIAPLMENDGQLSLAGDPNVCDYLDFVLAQGAEEEALSALLDALGQRPWQEVALWGLPEGSPTLELLPRLASAAGYQVHLEREAVAPQMALPASWEEYLESLPGKDRHELLRKLRRLSRVGDHRMERLQQPDEVAAALDEFIHLHRISRPEKAHFMTERMDRFFRRLVMALAEEGAAQLWFLRLAGERVAGLLCFTAPGTLQLYNSGYDPAYGQLAVGLLSKALLIEEAIREGYRRFDFLRGAEPYKYDLGARDRSIYRCLLRRG
jgi:CelD/BcsL family acetyltransferase involved in cellulose biosynthesis